MQKIGILVENNGDDVVDAIVKLQPTTITYRGHGAEAAQLLGRLKDRLSYEPRLIFLPFWTARGGTYGFNTLRTQSTVFDGSGGPTGTQHFDASVAYEKWRDIPEVKASLQALAGLDNVYFSAHWEMPMNSTGRNENGSEINKDAVVFINECIAQIGFEYGLRFAVPAFASGRGERADWETAARDHGLLDRVRNTEWSDQGIFLTHGEAGLTLRLWHGPEGQAVNGQANQWDLVTHPRDLVKMNTVHPANMIDTHLAMRYARHIKYIQEFGGGGLPMVVSQLAIAGPYGQASYGKYTGGAQLNGWRQFIPHWLGLGILDGKSPERFYAEELAYFANSASVHPDMTGATVPFGQELGSQDVGMQVINEYAAIMNDIDPPPIEEPPVGDEDTNPSEPVPPTVPPVNNGSELLFELVEGIHDAIGEWLTEHK